MSRIARDREEKRREAAEAELREKLKHMTDDERRQWERSNPKVSYCFNLGSGSLHAFLSAMFLASYCTFYPSDMEAAQP